MIAHDTIPGELLDSSRAVLWNYVEVPDRPKPTKVPYQVRRPTTKAAVDDAGTWGEMREAILAAADGKADVVGIVLGDGLVGVDLDGDCRDPQTGVLTADAHRIVEELASYTEISPSGTGVHVLLRGTLPPGRRRIGAIEMYSDGRYFTVTGQHVAGTPSTIEPRTEALARLHARIFPSVEREPLTPRPTPDVTLDDAALLAKAGDAKNGARFSALCAGDTSAYNGDDSAADLALCNLLAFWTDRDAARIDRLFRQSGLMRQKWDERRGTQTYAELTITRALESCTEGYSERPPRAAAPPDVETATPARGFPDDELEDAVDVSQRGREIDASGIPYLLDGIIPNLGMLGFLVAYAKVGKTTFGQALAACVAEGRSFLDRDTVRTKVLVLAAEDPPEYTAWLARHLHLERGHLTFRTRPLVLDTAGLAAIVATVQQHGYGLVLIASWQAVVRGLVKDENDNAGGVQVVERVKLATRETGIPWLIDAHSGKGEDQADEADPSKAMRGASAAAGAADYTLSLRYANGTFGSQRRLSGKGRFVSFAPLTLEFTPDSSTYTVTGTTKDVHAETTWQLICATAALDSAEGRSLTDIGRRAGIVAPGARLSGTQRQQITAALSGRQDVGIEQQIRRGQKTTLYRRLDVS